MSPEIVSHCVNCGKEFTQKWRRNSRAKIVCEQCGPEWSSNFKTKTVFYCPNCGEQFKRNRLADYVQKDCLCNICSRNLKDDFEYSKRMRGRIVVPPFGYKFKKIRHADDRMEVGGILLNWSDDADFQKQIKQSSLRKMLQVLRENGFSSPHEKVEVAV